MKDFPGAKKVSSTSVKKKLRVRRKKRKRNIGKHISHKGGLCTFRSSWERLYFEYLDVDGNVVSYISEGLKIPYMYNRRTKKMRNYIPDLLITYADGSRALVEIKPKRKLSRHMNVKKFDAAREWCLHNGCKFVIITEDDLKALGLFDK